MSGVCDVYVEPVEDAGGAAEITVDIPAGGSGIVISMFIRLKCRHSI